MTQIIEGVDNEVTVVFFLLTGMVAVLIPWYLFRPRHSSPASRPTPVAQANINDTINLNQDHIQQNLNNGNFTDGFIVGQSNNIPVHNNDSGDLNSVGPIGFEQFQNNQVPNDSASNYQTERQDHLQLINVRIKHLESDTLYHISQNMTLGEFRRHCFPSEVDQGKLVRLIFGGRVLREDTQTLHKIGIQDGCAVHAHISEVQQPVPGDHAVHIEDLEISHLLVPLLTIAMLMGWLAIFAYDDIFSAISLVIFALLTLLFLLFAFLV